MRRERLQTSEIQITFKEFEKILPEICDASISRYPGLWKPDNPLSGTCVPVSMVAQTIYGGKLVRANLKPYPEFRKMYWHWANILPNNKFKDFTKSQFGSNYPKDLIFIEKNGFDILHHPDVFRRYDILYRRLLRHLDSR